MATNANHPLAVALDQRIRAVVNEAVAEALREQVGQILNEQLAGLIGGKAAPAAAKPAAKRGPGRPRKTESAARTAAAKPAAKRGPGRPRKSETAATRSSGTKATAAAAGAQKCEVVGCKRPYRSRGYCAAHYQAARKYGWPMPATKNFEPPARPSRGRPAASA